MPFFKKTNKKFAQMYVLPILTKTTKHHECTPRTKKPYFLGVFDMPTQKSPNLIKTF